MIQNEIVVRPESTAGSGEGSAAEQQGRVVHAEGREQGREEVARAGESDERAADGEDRVEDDAAADRGAEEQARQLLEAAQVHLATPVHTVNGEPEGRVGAEERVALPQLGGAPNRRA